MASPTMGPAKGLVYAAAADPGPPRRSTEGTCEESGSDRAVAAGSASRSETASMADPQEGTIAVGRAGTVDSRCRGVPGGGSAPATSGSQEGFHSLMLSIPARTVTIKTPTSCASGSRKAGGDSPHRSVSFSAGARAALAASPGRRPRPTLLRTPSCASNASLESGGAPTPGATSAPGSQTPGLSRQELKLVGGGVGLLLFDFDGTLTSVPGEKAKRGQKKADLEQRARLLGRYLEAFQNAGIVLGIITKSQEGTVRDALAEAGLQRYFAGPVIGNAIGFEGKAGFIEELLQASDFPHVQRGEAGLGEVLLVDDDVRELRRAQAKGIQTFPAPQAGGLQEDDLAELLASLGVERCLEDDEAQPKSRTNFMGWLRLNRGARR